MTNLHKLVFIAFCICGLPLNLIADEATPLIVAHRGLLRHAPENTLANFRACLELRLGFEMDVQRTKDGTLVCIHDSTVDRTTNGKGKVSELTLEEIRKLDAGKWFDPKFKGEQVPTIDEVLALIAQYRNHNVLIAVDLKAENVEADVVKLAMKHRVVDRLIFIGRTIINSDVRKNLLLASSKVQVARVANNEKELPQVIADQKVSWAYVRFLPTMQQMAMIRATGKKVFIAGPTVSANLPKNWRHAVGVGIDAILTDYPFALRENVLRSKH